MPRRSARNKIRYHAKEVIDHVGETFEHLKIMSDLAAGQSPFLNENLPKLVVLMQEIERACIDFRDHL